MKRLIFDMERFSSGGYSKLFKDVITSLMHNGVIMSQEASIEVYKAIWENGLESMFEESNLSREQKWDELKNEL